MSFPKDFVWGTATASFQVEGATKEDGRGSSIWDTFCRTPGKVFQSHNGDRACDQFHRYREDIALMRELGVDSYRFSIAWPRIFPESMDNRNSKGFDYYHRLIDELLKHNIKPAVTLYHWDLPQYLEERGGWANRETAYLFAQYAETCFKELGDKVPLWITLNEPWCSSFLGYFYGVHAPGQRDPQKLFSSIHHLNLAHGLALQSYRKLESSLRYNGEGSIGITHNLVAARAASRGEEDREAADRVRDGGSRVFLNPLFGRPYPERFVNAYKERACFPIEEGDEEIMMGAIDFLGVNYYTEDCYKYDPSTVESFKAVPTHYPKSDMGWDTVPEGLYRLLHWIKEEYGTIPIYVTENGYAAKDQLVSDHFERGEGENTPERCHDRERIDYLKKHLHACSKAIDSGINLKGYYLWSFLDNFEWAYGYSKRFGIVYCDYQDMRRIPKDSFYYYREVIAGNKVV